MTAEPVDVVIPVHDRAGPVVEAIGSVLAQTHTGVRVRVVDDGSTDGTAEVLDRLAETDDRIHVTHQPNAGPAAARNRGLADCTSRYVTFLDSDDLMVPDRLEWQLAHLAANPDVDGVVGTEEITVAPGVDPPEGLKAQIARSGPQYYWHTIMAPLEAIRAVGGYDESLPYAEDIDLAFRLRQGGLRLDYVDRLAVHRRILGDNISYLGPDQERVLLELTRRRGLRSRADGSDRGSTQT